MKTKEGRIKYGKVVEEIVLKTLQLTKSNKGVWEFNNIDDKYAADIKYIKKTDLKNNQETEEETEDNLPKLYDVKGVFFDSELNSGYCNPNSEVFRVSIPLETEKVSGSNIFTTNYSLSYLENKTFKGLIIYYPVSQRIFGVGRNYLEDIKRLNKGEKPINEGVYISTSKNGHKYMAFKTNLVKELVNGRWTNYTQKGGIKNV